MQIPLCLRTYALGNYVSPHLCRLGRTTPFLYQPKYLNDLIEHWDLLVTSACTGRVSRDHTDELWGPSILVHKLHCTSRTCFTKNLHSTVQIPERDFNIALSEKEIEIIEATLDGKTLITYSCYGISKLLSWGTSNIWHYVVQSRLRVTRHIDSISGLIQPRLRTKMRPSQVILPLATPFRVNDEDSIKLSVMEGQS